MPLAFSAVIHKTALDQNFHVVGKGRLGDFKPFQQLAAAFFPIGEHFYDLQPVCIAQSFADECNVHRFHSFLHRIDDCLCE